MPCLYCTKQQSIYHHSGADNSNNDPNLPTEILEQTRTPAKDSIPSHMRDVRRCETCGSIWTVDYNFTDRPPLIVEARRSPPRE